MRFWRRYREKIQTDRNLDGLPCFLPHCRQSERRFPESHLPSDERYSDPADHDRPVCHSADRLLEQMDGCGHSAPVSPHRISGHLSDAGTDGMAAFRFDLPEMADRLYRRQDGFPLVLLSVYGMVLDLPDRCCLFPAAGQAAVVSSAVCIGNGSAVRTLVPRP